MQVTNLYILSGPDGLVRYVGKTTKPLESRLRQHFADARSGQQNHRCKWLRANVGVVAIDLVASVGGDGASQEVELIASLRALGARLVNGTDGGEGTSGCKASLESRAKMAAAQKGRRHPDEVRAKISAANKGRKYSRGRPPLSAAEKEAARERGRRVGFSALARARSLAANMGTKRGPLSPECKAKIAETKLRITAAMLALAREKVELGWTQQRTADLLGVSQAQLSLRLRGRCR